MIWQHQASEFKRVRNKVSEFERVRGGANQQADERGRASIWQFWQARANASEWASSSECKPTERQASERVWASSSKRDRVRESVSEL